MILFIISCDSTSYTLKIQGSTGGTLAIFYKMKEEQLVNYINSYHDVDKLVEFASRSNSITNRIASMINEDSIIINAH